MQQQSRYAIMIRSLYPFLVVLSSLLPPLISASSSPTLTLLAPPPNSLLPNNSILFILQTTAMEEVCFKYVRAGGEEDEIEGNNCMVRAPGANLFWVVIVIRN